MIIGKKEKGNIMKLYRSSLNEVESFSMLILSVQETKDLLNSGKWIKQADNSMIATYENKDPLDVMWKKIAVDHMKDNDEFKDVSKRYISSVSGTSKLIRDDKTKTIRIARRKNEDSDNYNSINIICINNNDRELFFEDCHKSESYKQTKKYLIKYIYDSSRYLKWSQFMNSMYLEGLKRTKQ